MTQLNLKLTPEQELEFRDVCDLACDFANRYVVNFAEPPKLKILSQKYSKAFRRLGFRSTELALARDSRFEMRMGKNGGVTVHVAGASSLEKRILEIVASEGPIKVPAVKAYFEGSGIQLDDFDDAFLRLIHSNQIVVSDAGYRIA